MAAYTEFQNILPDPNNQIGEGGQTSGNAGPGFASMPVSYTHLTLPTNREV